MDKNFWFQWKLKSQPLYWEIQWLMLTFNWLTYAEPTQSLGASLPCNLKFRTSSESAWIESTTSYDIPTVEWMPRTGKRYLLLSLPGSYYWRPLQFWQWRNLATETSRVFSLSHFLQNITWAILNMSRKENSNSSFLLNSSPANLESLHKEVKTVMKNGKDQHCPGDDRRWWQHKC